MAKREEDLSKELAKYGIEYIDGYTGDASHIKVKCMICGYQWETSHHNLIQKLRGNRKKKASLPCKVCRDKATSLLQEQKKAIIDAEIKRNKIIKDFAKWLKDNTIVNYGNAICKNCGKEYVKKSSRNIYCGNAVVYVITKTTKE